MEGDKERLQRTIDSLQREVKEMRNAFWAWEAIELAAQNDPEEQRDAEDLWDELTLIMLEPEERIKAVERRKERRRRNAASTTP